ncbi:MAG: hypothetical protein O2999_10320, partial [Nitrospirae bacterium]|nr:hypothetical protein [Nitrospirota bacterium]
MGISLGAPNVFAEKVPNSSSSLHQFTHGLIEGVQATSKTPRPETADAMLIRKKEWQWNRYLKSALHLPEWIDLGLENRT